MLHLEIRNESSRKRLYRRDTLLRLAERVCRDQADRFPGKPAPARGPELSVLFCDDHFMAGLNKRYRNKRGPTDVLSFRQPNDGMPGGALLGDIVISLETVERFCGGDRGGMRTELRLLFCHGLLHLLGYDHGTKSERQEMNRLQARYLDLDIQAAWRPSRGRLESPGQRDARGGR